MIRKGVYTIIVFLMLCIAGSPLYALDAPHTSTNTIDCDSCHFVYGDQPALLPPWTEHAPVDIDDTQYNTLCWSCHNDITAPYVSTHSSLQLDNGYGDWTIECATCHNPHSQKQIRTYQTDGYLYQGTVSAVDSTTVTETGAGWTVDEYIGFVAIPNIVNYKSYNYKIISNTSDTLTLAGPVNLTKVSPADTFAIAYGKLLNSTVVTPNSGSKTVRFFDNTGTNSFADGDASYDGICEACHTQTDYHRNDATGDHTHNAGQECARCHSHTVGFKVQCDLCHGFPPTLDAASGGPNGLVNDPGVTGSSIAGAHEHHVTTKGFECSTCHYNSVGAGATHNNGLTITLGFDLFSGTYQGGSYDGQSGISYNAATTNPVTSVTNTGTKTCSTIYCHSSGQSTIDKDDATPTYASPVWDDPSSVVCGSCHKVTEASGLISGGHAVHLGTVGVNGCSDCHTGAADNASSYNSANHVNTLINVSNSYTAGGAPGNDYGTCSAAACHDDGTGSSVVTPVWGTISGACTVCHDSAPSTGSHNKHLSAPGVACSDCHKGAIESNTVPEQHLDGNVDVYDTVSGDLGYPENKTKGSAYSNCTAASCHDDGTGTSVATPAWGTASPACTVCHDAAPSTGSHTKHLAASGVACNDCHDAAVESSTFPDQHQDGNIDVYDLSSGDLGYPENKTKGSAYSNCTTAACHDDGTGTTVATPNWGSSPVACSACHEAAPTTGSHTSHLAATGVACNDCHDVAVEGTTVPSQHLDTNIDVYDSASGDLGYPENKALGTAYTNCTTASCHDDATGNIVATPDWGVDAANCTQCHAAVPATGSHTKHLSTTNYNTAECADCHKGAVQSTTAPDQHIDGDIDVYYSTSGDLGYPQDEAKGGSPYESCSTVYCHSTGQSTADKDSSTPTYATVTWGDTAACGTCHKVTEASGLTSGSHAEHLGSSGVNGCADCHTGAENDASAYDSTSHVNALIDVANSYTAGGAAGNDYGNCMTNCHGSVSETWGTDLSSYDTCTKCHGEKAASPSDAQKAPGGSGVDTNGDSAATDDEVGAHQAHMTLSSGYTNQLNSTGNCNECHKVPSAAGDAGHIDSSLPAEVYPGTISPEKADLNSVTPAYSSGTCTVYCHGASMPRGTTDGSDTAPEWNQAGYLSGTPGDNDDGSGDCEKCHGAPPNIAPHTGSETLADCDTCHLHFNNDGSLNNSALHINGIVEAVAGCNGCHSYPPNIGDGKAYQDAPTSEGKGAHATHITNIAAEKGLSLDSTNDTFGSGTAAAVCGVCHTNIGANHMAGTRMINFGDATIDYQFGPSVPVYNGVPGTSSGTTPKTCSNISCHFGVTPTWQDPATAGN
jgi:predicted CxxxxCH...CXXCH cytochrome family protein